MGHKKKGEKSALTLRQQAYQHLNGMLTAGEGHSKHEDRKLDLDRDRIYSFKTYNTYRQTMEYFIRWLEINHPEIKTMKRARKYAREWLESLEGKYSAYTIQTRAKGIGKYYCITPTDPDYYEPPVRHREDIARSRQRTKTDAHFSELKNEPLVHFCEHTGLRREGLESIKKESLYTREKMVSEAERIKAVDKRKRTEDENIFLDCYERTGLFRDAFKYFIMVCEKGGKWRFTPVIGSDDDVKRIVERFDSTAPGHRVWKKISKNIDLHSFRADYAAALYRQFARPIDQIPYDAINRGSGRRYQSDVYICRTDEKGKKLDKKAMLIVEKALGHETLHTFASHYAYKL